MTTYTEAEWREKGKRLFGGDMLRWEFVCPSCKKIQSAETLREFKDAGAMPDDSFQRCKGRFTGGREGPDKCDWASFGLFNLGDTVEIDKEKIPVFAFAEPAQIENQ